MSRIRDPPYTYIRVRVSNPSSLSIIYAAADSGAATAGAEAAGVAKPYQCVREWKPAEPDKQMSKERLFVIAGLDHWTAQISTCTRLFNHFAQLRMYVDRQAWHGDQIASSPGPSQLFSR